MNPIQYYSPGTKDKPGDGVGLDSLNGLTAQSQTFAVGVSGSDVNIASSSSTHTFNIPSASSGTRGVVSTGSQTFAGDKTFSAAAYGGSSSVGTTQHWFAIANGMASYNNANYNLGASTWVKFGTGAHGQTVATVGVSHATFLMATRTIAGATSGTHPMLAHAAIKPLVIDNFGGFATNAATLYIEGAATGAGVGKVSNNYALLVNDGTTRFGGTTRVDGDLHLERHALFGNGIFTSTEGTAVWDAGSNPIGTIELHEETDLLISGAGTGTTYLLKTIQGDGPFSMTFPEQVLWTDGPPVLASGSGMVDIITFVSDGQWLYGTHTGPYEIPVIEE